MKMLVTLSLMALWGVASAYQPSNDASSLRQVVVLSRHGVRGPYGLGSETVSEEVIAKYVRNPDIDLPLSAMAWGTSDNDDPEEIVTPKLTTHGYRVIKLMGEYFREHLYHDFLKETPCNQSFAYADANQRDNLTAEAFLSGSLPSCPDVKPDMKGTRLLFEQGQDPTDECPVCSRTVYEGIAGASDCRYLIQENREAIQELNAILDCCTPEACTVDSPNAASGMDNSSTACTFFDIPSQWNGAFYGPWKDGLSSADYFTEFLALQSLNNMTLPEPFTFEKVQELSKIHEAHINLVTNEVNSANFGATLLAHMTASFEQTASGKALPIPTEGEPHLVQSVDNRFLLHAAHDINILYIRNLLRLEWYTRGWHPHQPTPGGMLVFELHSSSTDDVVTTNDATKEGEEFFVKLFFVTASPDQMRNAETLSPTNPPDVVPVMIPLCSEDVKLADGSIDVRCSLSTFKSLIGRTLKRSCVSETLRPFVESLTSSSNDSGAWGSASTKSSDLKLSVIMWVLFAVLISLFMLIIIRHVVRRNRALAQPAKREYGALDLAINESPVPSAHPPQS